jgi:hypothetical protein
MAALFVLGPNLELDRRIDGDPYNCSDTSGQFRAVRKQPAARESKPYTSKVLTAVIITLAVTDIAVTGLTRFCH